MKLSKALLYRAIWWSIPDYKEEDNYCEEWSRSSVPHSVNIQGYAEWIFRVRSNETMIWFCLLEREIVLETEKEHEQEAMPN